MMQFLLDHPEAIAAFLSLLTAGFAAYATWQGPKSAAAYAEELRRRSELEDQRANARRNVFFTLMQERATTTSIEAVKALNSIDIVFHDSREVREAWSSLFATFLPNNRLPPHVQSERLVHLLRTMAAEIGLSESLRVDDFSRIYYPNALAWEEELRTLQRDNALKQLQAGSETAIDATPTRKSIFPPKPE